jgi:small subunit ribosomal protein S6
MSEALTSYEVTFILGESTTEADATAKLATITALIEAAGGSVTKHEAWGMRELAYRIKGNLTGFYTTLWADMPAGSIANFEHELRLDESVIRHLVTKAYTTAQPGSLYPVKEEEEKKERRGGRRGETEAGSAEEELRRSTSTKASKRTELEIDEEVEEITDEERQAKLDAALDSILSEATSETEEAPEETKAA